MRLTLILAVTISAACSACAPSVTTSTISPTPGGALTPRVYTLPYDDVFSEAVNAALLLKWDVMSTDKGSGFIKVETPMSMSTWGDVVNIRVNKSEGDSVRVSILSRTDGQVIDWGKGKKNILRYYAQLDQLLSAKARPGAQ